MTSITATVNGESHMIEFDGHESAVDVVRDQLGLTGTKLVCAGGVCGACTMQIDGTPVAGCLTPATALRDRDVTTVEGLATDGRLHPVQQAFMAHDGLQCGYCTPGFVVDAAAFVDTWRATNGPSEPDRHTIADALAGHLCRCGAYEGMYAAVAAACRGEFDGENRASARVDGRAKVTGQAVYTADVYPKGALEGVIVRSPIAAGEVAPIPADATPVMVDLLGSDRRVRYAGQPIAAVAAPTLTEARQIAADLPLEITPAPFVIDPDAALADDAPRVYDSRADRRAAPNAAEGPATPAGWNGNVRGPTRMPWMGTIAKLRVRSARRRKPAGHVQLRFETAAQLHTSFEPHATVADWSDPDSLRVWTSTQALDHVTGELAEHFDLDEDSIEVSADYIGGGFGSKLSVTPDMIAAVELSRVARRPVRVVLSRREELTATGNRPGSRTDVDLVVSDAGDLKAMLIDGASSSGVAINSPYALLSTLVYGRSPRLARDRDILTNAPPGTPFRGPGGPTYAWALEQSIDQAAHQIGRDPIDLRRGWDGNRKRQALYDWASALPVWKERPITGSQTGRYRRGVGVAAANWLYMVDPDTEIEVSVRNGRLIVRNAVQDMGTGSKTLLARAVASVFDIDPEDVVVEVGRAGGGTLHGPTSGGSRTTASIWPTAVEAAQNLRAIVGDDWRTANGETARATRGGDHNIRAVPITFANLQIGRGFTAAVHVAEVEVDTLTGKTRVLTVHGGLAIGVPHARNLAASQCAGSIIQGIGLALYENQILDPHTGLTLTSNLEDYRIPQLGDTPEITIHFHEPGWEHVPGGGVGLGEVATISPAASVGNAIFNATGFRPTILPVRPDRLLEGLR
ncbi:MAG: molybdopterin cofactor-binding domain-containing protein [Actinomycetota bacterium]